MMLVHVTTYRDGRELLGNTSGVNAMWRDLKTAAGVRRRAYQWARRLARAGDVIVAYRQSNANWATYECMAATAMLAEYDAINVRAPQVVIANSHTAKWVEKEYARQARS